MADPIPILPDELDVKKMRDFLDIQRQISEQALKQKNLYFEIGRFNASLEAKVRQRQAMEKTWMNQQRGVLESIFNLEKDKLAAAASGDLTNYKQLLRDIRARKEQLQILKDKVSMSKEASQIEIEMAQKQREASMAGFKFALGAGKTILGSKESEFTIIKEIGEQMMKLGIESESIAYGIGAAVAYLRNAVSLFREFDKAAWDFRKAMGFTRESSKGIRMDVERIAIDFRHVGVTAEIAYDSWKALRAEMGSGLGITKDLITTTAILKSQLGVSEEVSARFMRNLAAVSSSTMQSQKDMTYMAARLAEGAQVPLQDVMDDVASRSTQTLTMMSRLPNVIMRSAIELRRMGTSLNDSAKASRHMLDFTENINEEMDASVLIGRSINLQRARELAYRRDIEGSTKEILRIAQSINFQNLDTFQMEAFARATGRSVDELLRMLQADKQWSAARTSSDPKIRAMVEEYEKLRRENQATAKDGAKNLEIMLLTKANQERMTAIANKWHQIMSQLAYVVLPVIDHILAFAVKALTAVKWLAIALTAIWVTDKLLLIAQNRELIIQGILLRKNMLSAGKVGEFLGRGIARFFPGIARALLRLGPMLATFGTTLSGWAGGLWTTIAGLFTGFGAYMGTLLTSSISGIVSAGAGAMAAAGASILAAFAAGFGIGTLLRKIFPVIDEFATWAWLRLFDIWDGLVAGVKAAGQWVWKWMKWPFDKFAEWWYGVSGFPGKSPSKLGMSIVKGIMGVGPLLLRVLTAPFRLAFKFVSDAASKLGQVIWKGISSYFNMWRNIGRFVFNGAKHLGEMVWQGLKSVKDRIVDVVKHPFKTAWGGIKKLWGGHSPSELGLSIVQGLAAVGGKVQSVLSSPFERALAFILSKIPGFGKIAEKLQGNIGKSIEKHAASAYIPAVTVTPKGTTLATAKEKTPGAPTVEKPSTAQPMTEETGQKMVALLEKILAKDSKIHLDSQLVSTHLARSTEFRGGYGVNKVA